MPAKLRRSSAKFPMTNSEKAKTAESKGEENDENNNANEQMITNSRTMKYNATRIRAPAGTNFGEKKNSGATSPTAMKKGFSPSVPASPKNLPTMNSQRRTGRESTV